MWPTTKLEPGRGGFQNRDVGRTEVHDYGPDYGVDYARYSDPANPVVDHSLRDKILAALHSISDLEVHVKNGFVLVRGQIEDEDQADLIRQKVIHIEGVKDVVCQLWPHH